MRVVVYVKAADERAARERGLDIGERIRVAARHEMDSWSDDVPHASGRSQARGVKALKAVCTAAVGTRCKIHGKVCNPKGGQ